MSLEQVQEELKKQLAEAEAAENKVEEPQPEPEPEKEAEKEPEKPAEPEKTDENKQKEENERFARLRREVADAKKAKEELERRLADLERAKPVEQAQVQEPESVELPPVVQDIIQEHTLTRAERELATFEADVRAQNPDYDAVAGQYTQSVYNGLRVLNPDMSQGQLAELTKRKVLEIAGTLLKNGYSNPVEELYHRAKEMGFRAPEKKAEEQKEEREVKPDMAKVAANRARSAGMAAASGEERGLMTKEAAAGLTAAEWMKLPIAERQRLMYGK